MTDLDGRHRVQHLVGRPAVLVNGHDTLKALAEILAANEIGVALVRAPESGIEGIISERDLVRAIADNSELELTRVDEVMSEEVLEVDRSTEIGDAARLMLDAAVRHLVVMEDDKVFGVVSERDVLGALMEGDI